MTKLSQLKIDPEFQGQINPPTADEEQQLEQNILEERRLLNPSCRFSDYLPRRNAECRKKSPGKPLLCP